jgi:hypothetical protein
LGTGAKLSRASSTLDSRHATPTCQVARTHPNPIAPILPTPHRHTR